MTRRSLFKLAALLPFAAPALVVAKTAEPKLPEPKPERDGHLGNLTIITGVGESIKRHLADEFRRRGPQHMALYAIDRPDTTNQAEILAWSKALLANIERDMKHGLCVIAVLPERMMRTVRLGITPPQFGVSTSMPTLMALAFWVIEVTGYQVATSGTGHVTTTWDCRSITDRYNVFRKTFAWDSDMSDGEFFGKPYRPNWLTVKEAQEKRVCRICQVDDRPYPPHNPFILNYGEEYAHLQCLEAEDLPTAPRTWHRMD